MITGFPFSAILLIKGISVISKEATLYAGTSSFSRKSTLLKSKGEDDNNFIDCIWDTDPLYNTIREEYIFDYTLKEDSPARGTAYPDLILPETASDRNGTPRLPNPSLGALQ